MPARPLAVVETELHVIRYRLTLGVAGLDAASLAARLAHLEREVVVAAARAEGR